MKTKRMTMCLVLAVLAIGGLLAGNVRAALVMQIDTANEQLRITGSDSGTADYAPDLEGYVVGWGGMENLEDSETYYQYLGNDLFSQIFWMEVFSETQYGNPVGSMTILGAMNLSEFSSVTGSGIWVDYSGMSETLKVDFESNIGGILPVLDFDGTGGESGWSPVSVQAVPEPATIIILGLGSFCLSMGRKRKA